MLEEPRRVSLKQVAAAAGVSLATTSYSLRNDPRISRATAARVQAVAKRLGYRPNPRISALMSHIRHAQPVTVGERIAFLWLDAPPGVRSYEGFYEGARRRALQLGYTLEEFWLKTPGLSPQRLQQIIHNRGIAGMLISPRDRPDPQFSIPWDWSLFSPVVLGVAESVPELHHSAYHHYGAMRLAMLKLAAMGKARIAAVLDAGMEDRTQRLWSAAFLTHHPLKKRAWDFLTHVRADRVGPFAQWLRRLKPDAIVGVSWMIEALMKAGWRPPAGTTTVLLYWTPNRWGFGGVEKGEAAVAANGVDMVAGQLQRNERGVPEYVKVLLSVGRWIEAK